MIPSLFGPSGDRFVDALALLFSLFVGSTVGSTVGEVVDCTTFGAAVERGAVVVVMGPTEGALVDVDTITGLNDGFTVGCTEGCIVEGDTDDGSKVGDILGTSDGCIDGMVGLLEG
jgi:hypothetical protein